MELLPLFMTRGSLLVCNHYPMTMLPKSMALIALAFLAAGSKAQFVATFTVVQPPPFRVDVGEDQLYEPGLTLQAIATGGTGTFDYLWSPAQYLDDPTSPTPAVQGILGSTLFTVQVTDVGLGCTLTDDVYVYSTTGMSKVGDGALAVYPNPSDGLVRIQAPVAVQRVHLCSPSGALALEYLGLPMRELVMDVSALPAGVYFMTIEFIDGRSNTHKLCATSAH